MLHYFAKELLSNPLMIGGKSVTWEQLDGNRGWRVLDDEKDKELVEGLNKAASEFRGGIVKHTAESLEAHKKKYPWTQSASAYKPEMLRIVRGPTDPPPPKEVAAPAAVNPALAPPSPPAPIIPEAEPAPIGPKFKPATRKASSIAA